MNPKAPPRQRGAALLLLLAVLSLGGAALLIGALGGGRGEARREQRTLSEMALAREALVGFAVLNGRLPRPAVSAVDGRERPQPCQDEAACTGFLPWVALGVGGADAWSKLLRYSVTPAFTQRPLERRSIVATKTVLRRDAAGQLLYRVGAGQCSLLLQCAPALLYSSGKNNLGVSTLGLAQANNAPGNADEQHNDTALNGLVLRAAGDDPAAPGGSYDDMVSWVPLSVLFQRMNAAGQLP